MSWIIGIGNGLVWRKGAMKTVIDTMKTVTKTIGNVGVAGCNFNFSSAANANEQIIDLGAIIPAKSGLFNVYVITDAAWTNCGETLMKVGTTSGGEEIIESTNMEDLYDISTSLLIGVIVSVTASNIYVSLTPTNNWNSASPVGKISVYANYISI